MKAILVDEEKNLYFGDVPDPAVGDSQVLIRISCAAINRADLLQRAGDYPPPPGCPEWMGLEVSGIIEKMGKTAAEKSGFHVGDAVCTLLGGGGYAEYVTVEYDMLMPVPKGFSMEEAAAIPEVYATAYLNLFREGNLRPGETLLIHAGASGVGIAATQIAKAFGARVIASVRSDEKAEAIRPFGADVIYNSKKTDTLAVMEENPVDLVIDCVGGADMGKCFAALNRGGRWIMIATLGGNMTEIDLKTVYKKGIRLIGSTLRSRTPAFKAEILASLVRDVFPYFESNAFRPHIYKVYPWAEAETAQEEMRNNNNIGKIVLKIR